jgi:alkylation response protein AidB-like acyl-CoA dehydrogenase
VSADDLDLLYSDDETSVRDVVGSLLRDHCPADRVLTAYDGDRTLTADLWPMLARDLGLAGLLVPESHGGAGATAREAAVVLEELGLAVAPVPFLTSSVLATRALTQARTDEGDALLRAMAAGETTAALLVPLSATPDWSWSPVEEITSVAGVGEADVLLVPTGDGGLGAVPATAAATTPVPSLDETRPLTDVVLLDAPLTPVVLPGTYPVRPALGFAAALLASEQVGVAQWCLETTVGYLKQRRQFGRVVGGYQALKHRLADLYVQVESARAAARYAAAVAAAGDADLAVATAVAQSYCAEAAVHAAEECIQLHGGIGMTWEHPAHLYLKRAKADQLAFGTPGWHRQTLAALIDLPE